jgi:hypothetical protein
VTFVPPDCHDLEHALVNIPATKTATRTTARRINGLPLLLIVCVIYTLLSFFRPLFSVNPQKGKAVST